MGQRYYDYQSKIVISQNEIQPPKKDLKESLY
jgi:hypothetical protein